MVANKDFTNPESEAVIFDLDGTLLNSAPLVIDCFRIMVREMFGSQREAELTDAKLLTYLGPPLPDSMRDLNPTASPEDIAEMVRCYRKHYLPRAAESELFPGIPEALATLRQRGYRLAVATSKLEKPAREVLEYHGVADFFEVIGGATSDLRLSTKTDVLREVLRRLGIADNPRRAIMIGDRVFDVAGASQCGVPAVLTLWAKSALPGEEEGAVAVVETPEELLELFPARNQD